MCSSQVQIKQESDSYWPCLANEPPEIKREREREINCVRLYEEEVTHRGSYSYGLLLPARRALFLAQRRIHGKPARENGTM